MNTALLTYRGTRIRDRGEMLCMTDMWRSAGADASKRPADWARKEGATFIEFIAENLNMPMEHIVTAERGGRDPATWAHWQIGMAYAKYLDHEFHAWCNEVVRSHMELTRQAPSSIAILDRLFDQKLEPIHEGMREIRSEITEVRGNVVFLSKRVDDMAPRHDFTANTRRSYVATVWRFYFGDCPCCRKTKIVIDGREIKGAAHCDHFNGKERNAPGEGWLVCQECNYRLAQDSQFKERARRHFGVFQDYRFETFGNGTGQSPRKRRSSRMIKAREQPSFDF